MDGYAEFYISCNPPLLPNGVSSVIADVENNLGLIVIEVLYEPEAAWFKVISAVEHQAEISSWMCDRLERLLESEIGAITEYQDLDQDVANFADPKARPDVQVLTETPHVIPYPSLQQISPDISEQYEPFRYPENIKHLSHKRIWQGPEGLEDITVSRFLSKYEPLWPASLAPLGIEKLGELTNCQLSYNLRGTQVYIGSDDSVSALDAVTRKLDTLASFLDVPSATTSHLILTEKLESARLCYVWTTQIGLSRLTYVDPECSDLREEYKRIAGAVTLRIGITNHKGQLVPDSTTYPTGLKHTTHKATDFHPFEGYTYGNKRAGTTAVKDHKRLLQCSQPSQPEQNQRLIKPARKKQPTAAKTLQAPKGAIETKPYPQTHKSVALWLGHIKPGEPPQAPDDIEKYENVEPSQQTEQSLLDTFDGPINTPALVDLVVFGKQNDEPKSLFNTMNQKTAPEHSWANIASRRNPVPKERDDANLGQNVRVTDGRLTSRRSEATNPVPSERPVLPGASSGSLGLKGEQQEGRTEETTRKAQYDAHVSTTRVVPGMDVPEITPGIEECAKVISKSESKLHDLLEVFQVVPGRINVQARFGRLCIKGIPPAEVYMNPNPHGPFNHPGQIVDFLNGNHPHVEFSPILTTSAAEANLVPQMIGGRTPWVLMEKRVYFQFLCTERAGPRRLVVNVDADTFAHDCLPVEHEISQAFVHCTRRAWDIKLCVSRSDTAQITEDFEKFAASLVRSMDIKTNEIGEIVIEVEPSDATEWCVDRARIHHEARYRNGAKGPSCLTTTMIRVVERFPKTPEISENLYKGQSVPLTLPGNERVGQWFEASISSIKAEDMLQENVGLELGERTRWNPGALQRYGALTAICEPAIRMVQQMDRVGDSNENGHGTETDQPPFDAVEDSKTRDKYYSFW